MRFQRYITAAVPRQTLRARAWRCDGSTGAVGTVALVVGLFLYADLQRRRALVARRWAGAVLVGWGGFQLYDGIVQHKLLGLHQVRYDVELLPYDLTWNGAAVLGLVAWAYFTGFVTNSLGELTFAPDDLARLALLVALCGTAHWRVWDR